MTHSKARSWNHLDRFKTSSFDFTYSDPGSGKYPGEGRSNALQYSCLENLMDKGAWKGTVHRVAKRWTCLKQLILECEWALESITTNKASGDDGIQVEPFQIQKMMLWKCCTQHVSKFEKLSSGHSTGKGQFSVQSQRKAMSKNVQKMQNCTHLTR